MPPVKIWAKLQSQTRPDWLIEFPTYRPKAAPITIGRNPACTLCLQDNLTISNRHILLECKDLEDGTRAVVLHESSSNGTEVMGKPLTKGAQIQLVNHAKIILPIEEGKHNKSDYTFIFTELNLEEDGEEEGGENAAMLLASELRAIQDQCDLLAVEAARLCARSTMKPSSPQEQPSLRETELETVALGLLRALKQCVLEDEGKQPSELNKQVAQWEAELERLGVDVITTPCDI